MMTRIRDTLIMPRTRLARPVMGLVFLLITVAVAGIPVPGKAGPNLEFEEVASGIFLHIGRHQDLDAANNGDIANIGFIVGAESVAVIDPGGSPAIGQALRSALRAVTDLPVSHVILTHVHPDHVMGASAFADVESIVAHRNFLRALAQRGDFYRHSFAALFTDADIPYTLVPTHLVDEPMRIELGGRSLTVRAHRTAHTDHDLSIFDNLTDTLWAADLLFAERIPSLDGSLRGWLEVMDELAAMRPQLVIPGHGKPGPWQTLAEPQLRYLTALLNETRQMIKQNKRLSEAVEKVAMEEARRWLLFALHHPGNVARAYAELEWE